MLGILLPVMLGPIGMFGASTPDLTQDNPFDLQMDTYSKGGIYQADPVCQVRSFEAFPPALRPLGPSLVGAHVSKHQRCRRFVLPRPPSANHDIFAAC